MTDSLAAHFLSLHQQDAPLLMPNPWDIGSAKLLASLGFAALATTSSGFAATLGRIDGGATRDEVLEHARMIAASVPVPVSADLERCFADDPDGVAETVRLATDTGLAGCSIEDYTRADDAIYPRAVAADRVLAAAEAAHGGANRLVLTGRAENHIRRHPDLADTIERLQAYQDAGADVLFAPGVTDPGELATLIAAVDRPVNVLPRPGSLSVAELGALGVKRISVGGSLCWAGLATVVEGAQELLEQGTYDFMAAVPAGLAAARAAFTA